MEAGCFSLLVFGFALVAFVVALNVSGNYKLMRAQVEALKAQIDALERELRRRTAEPPPEPVVEPRVAASSVWEPAASPAAQLEERPSAGEAAGATLSTPPPVEPPPPPVAPPPPSKPFDWESLVGVKLFSWIAGVSLVLAAIFFLKYSVDHGWLSPVVRATLGLITGTALVVVCEMRVARGYMWTANALHGAGIAILYATLFSIHALWHLLPAGVVFALMLIVTAVAVMLSIRRDSVFIALLGLMGGFATPALLSTGENRPIGLFSYLLLLNVGLAWVAYRKRWASLTFGSLLFTVLYQWVWIGKFLTASQLPLAATIFAVFAIVGSAGLWLRDANGPQFERLGLISAALPLAFAIFAAAVPAYGARYNTLLGFLLFMAAGCALIAWKRGPEWLDVVAGAGVLLTFALWFALSYQSAAWPMVLPWVAAFVVLYLATGERADYTAALLLFAFPVLAAREAATAEPALLFASLFALLALIAAYAVKYNRHLVFTIGATLAIAAQAVWSAAHLTPANATAALVIYLAFGLLLLALPVIARRVQYLAIAEYVFLMYVASQAELSIPPWRLFTVLALLVVATGVASLMLRRGSLMTAAVAASQVVAVIWAANAPLAPWPNVALAVALVTAAFAVVWLAIARRNFSSDEAGGFERAAITALFLGHVVAIVAGQTSSVPLFGSLLVAHSALAITILSIAWLTEKHYLATLLVPVLAFATSLNRADDPVLRLLFAAAMYAISLAYPLLLGARAQRSLQPYLAAVISAVPFFFFARSAMIDLGYQSVIGVLPVVQALTMLALLLRLLRIEAPAERENGRLALVAAAALAFITLAVPLQLDRQWITIAWALEGAALVWLYRRIPHRGLLVWATGLFAVVFVRLVFNPAVFEYHSRSATPIFNWYLYTYLAAALAFYIAARLLPEEFRRWKHAAAAAGTVLLFFLVNIEIADFYSTGRTLTFNFLSAPLAQELTYTIGWALFAIAMLVAGIVMNARGARIAALSLLAITILKCFLHDLGRLGGLYRVGSLLGLAISLVIVGMLLQRFVLRRPVEGATT